MHTRLLKLSLLMLSLTALPALALVDAGPHAATPADNTPGAASARHAAQVFEQAVIRRHGWSEPLDIRQAWSLYAEFRAAGYDTRYVRERRAVVVLSGAVPGPLPAGWDLDAEALDAPYVLAARDDLDATLAQLQQAGYDYLLVLDPSRQGQVATLRDLAPQGADDSDGQYLVATASRRQEQEVGIYYVDLARHQLYRSHLADSRDSGATVYGQPGASDPRQADFAQRTALALADWRRPLEGSLLDADRLLPARLNQPVEGSQWQAEELGRLLDEDEAGFAHRLTQQNRQAQAASAAVATALGVDLGGKADDEDGDAAPVANALPDNADCADYAAAGAPEKMASDWQAALQSVAAVNGDVATGSFVLMDAHEQIGNLREAVAQAGTAGDRAAALTAALRALATGAGYLDTHLALATRRVDPDNVADAQDYYGTRLRNEAFNTVAARAAALRPDLVAGVYRVYQYLYSERGELDGSDTATVLARADGMLRALGRQLVLADRQLTLQLNDGSEDEALAAVSLSVNAHCRAPLQTAQRQAPPLNQAHAGDSQRAGAQADSVQASDSDDDAITTADSDNGADDSDNTQAAASDAVSTGAGHAVAANPAATTASPASTSLSGENTADDSADDDSSADNSVAGNSTADDHGAGDVADTSSAGAAPAATPIAAPPAQPATVLARGDAHTTSR